MPQTATNPRCQKITDGSILGYARAFEYGKVVSPEKLEIAQILRAYVALRKETRKRTKPKDSRNCDVMVTPAALRKGWERRCEYGTPCCPFEYALELFDPKEDKHEH